MKMNAIKIQTKIQTTFRQVTPTSAITSADKASTVSSRLRIRKTRMEILNKNHKSKSLKLWKWSTSAQIKATLTTWKTKTKSQRVSVEAIRWAGKNLSFTTFLIRWLNFQWHRNLILSKNLRKQATQTKTTACTTWWKSTRKKVNLRKMKTWTKKFARRSKSNCCTKQKKGSRRPIKTPQPTQQAVRTTKWANSKTLTTQSWTQRR